MGRTGYRKKGGEMEEEDEKKEWGPRDHRWHPQPGSCFQTRCPASAHSAPWQLRPEGLKREEQAQRGGKYPVMEPCNLYLAMMRKAWIRFQVSCTSQVRNYRIIICFLTLSVRLILAELYSISTDLEIIICLFTFMSGGMQETHDVHTDQKWAISRGKLKTGDHDVLIIQHILEENHRPEFILAAKG